MAAPFLVHNALVNGAATHAVVIGVGAYPYLNGGLPNKRTEDHGGMGQLTSPPISARLFASWLIKSFKLPAKPLATVSLLLSEAHPQPFVDPLNNAKTTAVEVANSANVHEAVKQWFARGTDPNNLLIFYFCGHGIAAGTDTALLLADYGANPLDSLEGALDFRRFRLGMNRCRANEQCYFVDACRNESETLIQANAAGRYIVKPGVRDPEWEPRKGPVFYATANGYKAYALPNEASVYTDALLKALRDLAAEDEEEGVWRVNTNRLHAAIDYVIANRVPKIPSLVPPTSDDAASFLINCLDSPPKVPVHIATVPPEAIGGASVFYHPQGEPPIPAPPVSQDSKEVVLELPTGSYDFTIKLPPDRELKRKSTIKPIRGLLNFQVPP